MLDTVQLRLGEEELAERMSEMRVWLDRHGYEADLFQYRSEPNGVLLRVDFKFEREAFAFAEAFGGTLAGRVAELPMGANSPVKFGGSALEFLRPKTELILRDISAGTQHHFPYPLRQAQKEILIQHSLPPTQGPRGANKRKCVAKLAKSAYRDTNDQLPVC